MLAHKRSILSVFLERLVPKTVSKNIGCYTFLNPYTYLLARKDIDLLRQFTGVYVDGEYLAKFIRFFFRTPVTRTSFDMTSAAPDIFSWAEENNKTVALIGTRQENIAKTIAFLLQSFPRLRIVYFRNGFFESSDERETSLDTIVSVSPDVVIVGMGAPLQERFLIDLWNKDWRGLGFTCGGFLHQSSAGLCYYPNWIDRYNLRWLYRVFDEPKLLKRYVIYYPLFVFAFLSDWLNFKRTNK